MAKKRASVQKRLREQNKRQREFLKSEKANRKRERRLVAESDNSTAENQGQDPSGQTESGEVS